MNCPKCGFEDIYIGENDDDIKRVSKEWCFCNRCGHEWEADNDKKPVISNETGNK
jgi:hypothetical protein